MPTLLSHPAFPLALGLGLGARLIPRRLLLAGVVASMLPDLDVVGFRLGVPYGDVFGHRGATHSICSAVLVALVAAVLTSQLRATRTQILLFVTASMASHGILDMFTDAGSGVALLWPWSAERYFAPWRFIEAAPLAMERMLGSRGETVIASELLWVWLPASAACLVVILVRRAVSRAHPEAGPPALR